MSAYVECPYCHHRCGEASLRNRLVELERQLAESKGRVVSITYGELCEAAPEVALAGGGYDYEPQSHDWDNRTTAEQMEFLLTIIRRDRKRLAELERDLAEETKIVDRIWDLFGRPDYKTLDGQSLYDLIQTEIDGNRSAKAEVEALRKDKERLDWLADEYDPEVYGEKQDPVLNTILLGSRERLREAIDAARPIGAKTE